MTQPKPIENKFKLGQKVQTTKEYNEHMRYERPLVFNVVSIALIGEERKVPGYGSDAYMHIAESQLEEVKEPLRAEFECEVKIWGPYTNIGYVIDAKLTPLAGKRTRVTIEEIVEES